MRGAPWATFSSPQGRYFVHGRRDQAVLAAALGDTYAGVLVSDFDSVSTSDEGRHQYCWAHLLRDADDLVARHRDEAGVTGWAAAPHALDGRARTVSALAPVILLRRPAGRRSGNSRPRRGRWPRRGSGTRSGTRPHRSACCANGSRST